MMIILDDVRADYLVTSGVSSRMLFGAYAPGGEFYTDEVAREWFLGQVLGISVRHIRMDGVAFVIESTESVSREAMVAIMEAEITYQGVLHMFYSFAPDARSYVQYDQEHSERWVDLIFREPE